ncbi:Os09g0468850 [Oryza sativa Japonica Group]|uniref:Os09g0468850 protein n=1 Tax=Oryza sativa subsp. japonica TaxID=39947 RepID=A0A0P0XN01_ORYSJ|nr:hypothetical protein EE612_048420 [Oryza sativa]BAT08539.1 Os09g0468850 [Oryza sativa Japonica Group]
MERMRAAREEADQLPVAELAEAHRAVPSPPNSGAVLRGGYGRDGGLVQPHRADVPHVVHIPAAAPRLLIPVAEPVVAGERRGRGPAPAAQDDAAAVEQDRGDRERDEQEGGEE